MLQRIVELKPDARRAVEIDLQDRRFKPLQANDVSDRTRISATVEQAVDRPSVEAVAKTQRERSGIVTRHLVDRVGHRQHTNRIREYVAE